MEYLVEWKNTKDKECLLVVGARQVGKTFIIREFGKQYYDNVVELNFFKHKEHRDIFSGSLNADTIISKISLLFKDIKFIPGKTLIFFDEIQDCGQARTALKFLAEDNRFDIVASGSMLGVSYKTTVSVPVGYEKKVEMYSMDFEEFLWANGMKQENINIFKEYFESKEKVDQFMNDTMLSYMREYMIVGGMPAVVKKFIETKNFAEVHKSQTQIIDSYLDDIAMYASAAIKPKARSCYLSLPKQLAKENKKFQYSIVEKNGTARKFDTSIEWLRDAGLVKLCTNVSTPLFPLAGYMNQDYFKAYATDIGILNAMYGFELKAELYNNTLKGPVKGGIYENLIADILIKKGLPLHFYKPSENRQEIEFLYTQKSNIIPIEVKAGNNPSVSLDEFIKEFKPPYGLKLIAGNSGKVDKKITLPLYMAMFL